MHIIAADVGGTKTRLIYADLEHTNNILFEARYPSGEFDSFEPLLRTFIHESGLKGTTVDAMTLALPGLVNESTAKLTNLPWVIHKQDLIKQFEIKNVYFMNDFQASAYGTCLMQENDMLILNRVVSDASEINHNGISVAVGAGTGLGVSWVQSGHYGMQAHDSEGGHIDFAPVNEQQVQLLAFLKKRFDHVSYERILSGDGLAALYAFCSGNQDTNIDAAWVNTHANDDQAASDALLLFAQIYGAYIGNIAVLFKPSEGIFITGGIAAKIIKQMQSAAFSEAYLNKGRMRPLVEKIAVYLVTNERIGVLGAMSETIKYCGKQDGQEIKNTG